MNIELNERVAVITGGSRGFGRAIALAMAQAGARVALAGRDEQALRKVHAELPGDGHHLWLIADVTDPDAVGQMAGRVLAHFGRADILVNNAGINFRKPLLEFPFDEWKRVVETNLYGPMLCAKALLPAMIERRWGRVVNIASMMAHVALPGRSAYCASKGGLVAFSRELALEVAGEGVTVNSISPGPFATEMNLPLLNDPEKSAYFTSRIPVGRWGPVNEIGALAVYLSSDQASFITGADFVIDGGWTAQ